MDYPRSKQEPQLVFELFGWATALIKRKIIVSSYTYKENQNGAVAKSYLTNGLLSPHIWLNICPFPHILGSPSSYMTLQLLHSEFPCIWGKFDFLFYQGHKLSSLPFSRRWGWKHIGETHFWRDISFWPIRLGSTKAAFWKFFNLVTSLFKNNKQCRLCISGPFEPSPCWLFSPIGGS